MFNRFDVGNDGTLGAITSGLIDVYGGSANRSYNPLDWNGIINQAFALGSHAISAFSGQNTGTQIGYNRSQGIFAIQGSQPVASYSNPYASMSPEQIAAYQRAQGGIAEDAFPGITSFISRNPLPIAAGVVAIYLLMREPPRRR